MLRRKGSRFWIHKAGNNGWPVFVLWQANGVTSLW